MKASICILVAASLLCGCVSVGHKLDESKVDQIKKNVTTREQVLQLVGKPDQISKDDDGIVTFQYIFAHSSIKASTFIPYAGIFVGGSNMQNQSLTVSFDTNNVVARVLSSYGASEMNMGATPNATPAK